MDTDALFFRVLHLSTSPQSVTLHTSHGDLKIEVFCEAVPKAAENFLALCAAGQYDGCLFHRFVLPLLGVGAL